MQSQVEQATRRRRSLRRAVRVEAEVASNLWDGCVSFVATDVSVHGLWLDTDLALDVGEELIVSLRPPGWPVPQPLTAIARVARVGLHRRKLETKRPGMGLSFADLRSEQAEWLMRSLRGLPPPLPRRRSACVQPPAAPALERHRPSAEDVGLPQIVLADGSRYAFRAEGSLLTSGRGRRVTKSSRVSSSVPITSAMTAILSGSPAARGVRASSRPRLCDVA